MARAEDTARGLCYIGAHFGKHFFRIRETHVRDHLALLLTQRRLGAVKLDLIVRGC
jgi:hypothetical protein